MKWVDSPDGATDPDGFPELSEQDYDEMERRHAAMWATPAQLAKRRREVSAPAVGPGERVSAVAPSLPAHREHHSWTWTIVILAGLGYVVDGWHGAGVALVGGTFLCLWLGASLLRPIGKVPTVDLGILGAWAWKRRKR